MGPGQRDRPRLVNRRERSALWHLPALAGLALWGFVRVGDAGTLTAVFWFAWLTYAALVGAASRGRRAAFRLALTVPALWLALSGRDLAANLNDGLLTIHPALVIDALLVPLPCLISLVFVTYAGRAPGSSVPGSHESRRWR